MDKIKLVIDQDKNIKEVFREPDAKKVVYKSFASIDALSDFLKSSNITQNKDYVYALAWDLDNKIQDLAFIPKSHYDEVVEYVFDDEESLESFIKIQELKDIHVYHEFLNKDAASDDIDNFFGDEPCNFEKCEELRDKYYQEIEESGGAKCPSCTRSALTQKYIHLITNKDALIEFIK